MVGRVPDHLLLVPAAVASGAGRGTTSGFTAFISTMSISLMVDAATSLACCEAAG